MRNGAEAVDNNLPFLLVSERHENVECVTHIHATMEIVLVTEGCLHMTVGNGEYDIPQGCGMFIEPFLPHAFHSAERNRCHVLMFSRELVSSFSQFLQDRAITSHLFCVSPPAMALAEALLPHHTNRPDSLCSQAVLAPLCHDIRTGCDFIKGKPPIKDNPLRIFEYISEHFTQELTIERVARAVGVSKVTVSKIFARTGTGFCYFLQYCRCTHAAKLLHTENLTIAQVAYESGFGSIRSFNRAFFKIYKVSPSQYKEERKEELI